MSVFELGSEILDWMEMQTYIILGMFCVSWFFIGFCANIIIKEIRKNRKGHRVIEQCGDCKWWIEQGSRTKDIDFQSTVIGWCKRLPHTETDKDQDDWCGEFEPRSRTEKIKHRIN